MRRDRFSTPVLLTFSELALFALLAVVLLHCLYIGNSNRGFKDLLTKISNLQNELLKATKEKDIAADRLLESIKKEKSTTEKIDALEKKLSTIIPEVQRKDETIQKLQDELHELTKAEREKEAEINALKKDLDAAIKERDIALAGKITGEAEANSAMAVKREDSIHQELIGLKGDLNRVIFILDCSGSMKSSGRWDTACEIVKSWLQYLNVTECALITFSDNAEAFPPKDENEEHFKFLNMTGKQGDKNRRYLLGCLDNAKNEASGEGYTNILAAIQTAYEYEHVSTIVLFTDGAPTRKLNLESIFRKRMKDEILELIKKNTIPINIVGLGNYFGEEYGRFLLQLTKETGGTFIGR